jgi:hypothetical protein
LLGRVQGTCLSSSEANVPAITSPKSSLTSAYAYCCRGKARAVRLSLASSLAAWIHEHAATSDGRAVPVGCRLRAQRFVGVRRWLYKFAERVLGRARRRDQPLIVRLTVSWANALPAARRTPGRAGRAHWTSPAHRAHPAHGGRL